MKKYLYLLLFSHTLVWGQADLHFNAAYTSYTLGEEGELTVNINKKDSIRFIRQNSITYKDLGAIGNGEANDFGAIVATHHIANALNIPVYAGEGLTFYIDGSNLTAYIETDTDFKGAHFIIDDRAVQNRQAPVFEVRSKLTTYTSSTLKYVRKGQKELPLSFDKPSLVILTNAHVKRYIRKGLNQNNGQPQTDILFVNKKGVIHKDSPVLWDFDQITECTILPTDTKTLQIRGGKFTTLANQEESKYNYYSRNISIKRSQVVVDGLTHLINEEGDSGAPYGGFIAISDCAFVTVKNCLLSGHKTYSTIGNAGKPVSMGSYDILVKKAINVSFQDCSQSNDIDDKTYWGIMGSNYCKNLVYENCRFSRFDAHMGVANARISGCTLGHMGINAIGSGVFIIENTEVRASGFVNFRPDYGSTWLGEFIIKNCTFYPAAGKSSKASILNGFNDGTHDFGYGCSMPEEILIKNLLIKDSSLSSEPTLFGDFNPSYSDSQEPQFPYLLTKKVILENVRTTSGREIMTAVNPQMFGSVIRQEKP